MPQILNWNVNYYPNNEKWTTITCNSMENIISYLTPTSIILVSQKTIESTENLIFLITIKLRMPNSDICIIDSDYCELFDNAYMEDLNSYISEKITKKFDVKDHKEEIVKINQYLNRVICKNK